MGRIVGTAAAVALIGIVWTASASAAARPRILSLAATPQLVAKTGGIVDVRAQISGARNCVFENDSDFVHKNCRRGVVHGLLRVPRNTKTTATTLRFRLTVDDGLGHAAVRTIAVTQAAGERPHPALAIATTGLDLATVGAAYSTTLTATGGTAPYTWSLVSGSLPPGLALSPGGALTGTPTAPGQYTASLQLKDATGRTASTTVALYVVAPSVPLTPGAGTDYRSTNWSGYALLGGPFTAAAGTFDVPQIYAGSAVASTSEWVGIDGWSASNPGILQAGADESYDPATNRFEVYAWVELYPAPSIEVPLAVAVGDQINVAIQQLGPTTWTVVMKNLTTGKTWQELETWSGPATSAEWIVEAPYSTTLGQLPVAAFSPVTFTQLTVNPSNGDLGRLLMVQSGQTVSTPSPLTANGFTVANGSVTPAAP